MRSFVVSLTFVVGGATGVLLAVPPADFVLHNSMFLVAHFHNVMVSAVLFAAFFATDAVVQNGTADGPKGADLFDLNNAALETALLLLSSFVCGMATLALAARRMLLFQAAMALTFLLGAGFVALEADEFYDLIARGYDPSRSAFLSGFFTLVGSRGLHVSVGLLRLLTMMAQALAKGFRADIVRRTHCFALFWHALDIVWVGIFSIVYLIGVLPNEHA